MSHGRVVCLNCSSVAAQCRCINGCEVVGHVSGCPKCRMIVGPPPKHVAQTPDPTCPFDGGELARRQDRDGWFLRCLGYCHEEQNGRYETITDALSAWRRACRCDEPAKEQSSNR